ncbi:Metallothionein expression activator [Colletotrichum fructicola]|nr:Metallothionein expression activator [Colletotrichum fructicola]
MQSRKARRRPCPALTSSTYVVSSSSAGGGRLRGPGGMAADPHNLPDPAVDTAIRQLLDQQAEIQARLAALLPAKYGPNVKLELDMLRHKLRVLQTYSDHHQISSSIPVVSELEEARSLQYRCECIETACLEQGHDLSDPSMMEALRRSLYDEAPVGYAAWFDRNLANYDPVVRGWRMRDSLSPSSRAPSYKCWDERCIHYIYGFYNKEDRDAHAREHSIHVHRDSGMSVGNTPPIPFPEYSTTRSWGPEASKQLLPLQLPNPSSGAQLASLTTAGQPRDRRDTLQSYSLISDPSGPGRGSVDSEVDPLLPPLKRSRVGQSRLQSIGELRLLQDSGPCLRCMVTKQPCDSSEPCYYCTDQPTSPSSEFWRVIGCHRGPLEAFSDIMLSAPVSPRQTQTPITSPLAQRRSMNEHLENSYRIPPDILHAVKANLDFDDGFWWTEELASLSLTNPTLSNYSREAVERPPPILSVLTASWNGGGTSYNFLHLLKTSGLIAATREMEEAAFPVLYRAKLLLREVIFWDLQQPEPSIRIEGGPPHRALFADEIDHDAHYSLLYNSHLRRAHFNPHRGGKASGDWPPMTILKDWMREVRQSVDIQDNDESSGGEEGDYKPPPEYFTQAPPPPPPIRSPNFGPAMIAAAPPSIPMLIAPAEPMVPSQLSSPSTRTLDNRTRCPHPDCGRVFKDLAAHMLTHQEERPEKCPIETCEYHIKGFARKYDKNRHALTHYKGTMICPFCPGVGTAYEKAFNRADVFKRHLTSVHNVEQTPPNSRKLIISGSGNVRGDGAQCSICQGFFGTAQEFYEHLDDCVLNVIVPSSAKTPRDSSLLPSTSSGMEDRERMGDSDTINVKPMSPPGEKMDINP